MMPERGCPYAVVDETGRVLGTYRTGAEAVAARDRNPGSRLAWRPAGDPVWYILD